MTTSSAISASGTTASSPYTQPPRSGSGAGGNFADMLASMDRGMNMIASATGRPPVAITGGIQASLPNGLSVGVFSMAPVDSAGEQQMAESVEQMVSAFQTAAVPGASSGNAAASSNSSSSDSNNASGLDLSKLTGIDVTMQNGVQLTAFSMGADQGGPSMQDMTNGMKLIVDGLEEQAGTPVSNS